jgi:hypothetical protein
MNDAGAIGRGAAGGKWRPRGEHPEWADNLVANTLGCSDMTVKAVRQELEAGSQIRKVDRLLGADGKWRKVKSKKPPAEPRAKKSADPPLDSKQTKALAAARKLSTPLIFLHSRPTCRV